MAATKSKQMSQAKEHEQDDSFDEDTTLAQHYETREGDEDNEDEGEEANFSRVDLSPRTVASAHEAVPPLQSSSDAASMPLFGSISSPFAKLRFTGKKPPPHIHTH